VSAVGQPCHVRRGGDVDIGVGARSVVNDLDGNVVNNFKGSVVNNLNGGWFYFFWDYICCFYYIVVVFVIFCIEQLSSPKPVSPRDCWRLPAGLMLDRGSRCPRPRR
jgi:hypothetical protein